MDSVASNPPQWIRDSWSRPPRKADVLFLTPEEWATTPKVERGPWPANARLHMNGDENGRAYALGYQRGAQLLADYAVRESSDQDLVIYPILFLYRHAVELFLKRFIPVAADLVDEPLKEHERSQLGSHRLDILWSIFKPRLHLMEKCEMTQDQVDGIESYIRQLSDVDEQSFSFRFAADKDGNPNLADLRHINIMRITVLLEPFVAIFEGIDEIIHERYQSKCEYMEESRQQALSDGECDYE